MKTRYFLLSLLMACSIIAYGLTDKQVIEYIKQQTAAGKTDKQIGKELLAKGVTPEQAQRIKAAYEKQMNGESDATSSKTVTSDSRLRTRNSDKNTSKSDKNSTSGKNTKSSKNSQNSKNDKSSSSRLSLKDQRLLNQKGENYNEEEDLFSDENEDLDLNVLDNMPERQIYGHDLFNKLDLTFEPSENVATPQNYRLGPGDEVIIDIWGASEDHLRETISPEGSIMIEQLGPVYLNGLSVKEANTRIKNAFARKYAGMTDSETDIQVTLGQVRSISVNVLGEVETPGTYQVSPFASVFNALYNSGGISDIGSLRNIQVMRNGKKVAGIDIYEYLFNGKTGTNIKLQEGDVIIVPPYGDLVNLDGNVRRPMYYEIKSGETVKNLLDYAGGLSGDAYTGMVSLSRQNGAENQLFNIDKGEFASYKLKDGDIVTVGTVLERFANKVELRGAVMRPGDYAIGQDTKTVSELIKKADGLTEDAYTLRALLFRENDEMQPEMISLNLQDILSGHSADIPLKRNDIIEIAYIQDLSDIGDLVIGGQVTYPGKYPYAENTTVEDLIVMAGGLKEGASTARIDISRRIVDPTSTEPSKKLAKVYSISIENGLAVGKGQAFKLKPYDQVEVRKSPGYSSQQNVMVAGEVLFDGTYALEKRNERISDLIKRAGGILEDAYIKGAHLSRKLSDAEVAARQETLRLAQAQSSGNAGDSIALSKLEVSDRYNVGIDLEMAINNPGSHYDLVLQPGDSIYVPELQSTVKIAGDVMYPNAVIYVPGKKLSYYVNQAGGYGQQAKKSKAFVVYLNGSVAIAKRNTPIEPGCQIIVPSKPKNGGADWSKILAIATSVTSLATMAATVTNMLK